MVSTRSHSVGLLYEKGVRLRRKLKALGMLRGTLPIVFLFGSAPPSRMTRQSVWEKFLDPTSIMFSCTLRGVEYAIGAGCIHPLDARCPVCDVHPDADVKHNEVFLQKRAWKVCLLWNTDPFVLGKVELLDGE